MRRNLRQEMLDKTASMRSTTDVQGAAATPVAQSVETPRVPRTGPGQLAALSTAQQALAIAQERIKELEAAATAGAPRHVLSVSVIKPNPWQPRRYFDQEALDDLADNIDANGQLQPIVVRPHPSITGHYQIAMGERRWLSRKQRDRPTVDAVIVDYSDQQMAITALSENIHREDLSDYEISRSLLNIQEVFPTRKDVAEAVGISRSQLYRLMAFQKLPKFIQDDLEDRPKLLGATAAEDIAAAMKRGGDGTIEILQELWTSLKQGELDQADVARKIDLNAAARNAVSTTRTARAAHVRMFYREGSKAGDIRRDERHLMIRLRNDVVDEEMEKRIADFMEGLFPKG
ncbi:chromosome partitioning protein ParB [Streptomyces cavourensis]|nr:chromosome partitioning protein ParB [Streptomyces cavourensis]